MSPAPGKRFKVGDKVMIAPAHRRRIDDHTRVFTVATVNPKNYRCSADDGGRGLNYPDEALVPHDPDAPPTLALGVPFVPREFFDAGAVVTLAQPYPKLGWTTETPLVVLADKERTVNVTRIGGAGSSYLRVPPAGLVRRDLEWLKAALA